MPCRLILSLIEPKKSVKALSPRRKTSLAGTVVVTVVDVGILRCDEDMAARKTQQLLAAATLNKIEGHRSLSVQPSFGGDSGAEGGSEGTDDADEWVQFVDRLEKLKAGRGRVDRLVEVEAGVDDIMFLEKA